MSDDMSVDAGEMTDTGDAAETSEQQAAPEKAPAKGDPAASSAAAALAERRWKLQADRGEVEMTDAEVVDALRETLGEDGFKNTAQLARLVRRKLSEVGAKEAQIREAVEDIKDPRRLKQLLGRAHGPNARKVLEDMLYEEIEQAQMDPKERAARAKETDLERREREINERERKWKERESAGQVQALQQSLGKTFASALREVGLEPTAEMIADMAKLGEGEEALLDPRSLPHLAREFAAQVKRAHEGRVSSHLQRLIKDPAKLIEALGPEGMRALRAADVQRAKAAGATVGRGAAPNAARKPPPAEKTRRSVDDWLDRD